MSDSKNGARSSGKREGMKREEAIDRIQELKEKWMGTKRKHIKISDEKLFREVQKLTEEIHRQAEPEEYKEIFAEVEGKMIYKRYRNQAIDRICSRIAPFLACIFAILVFALELFRNKDESSIWTVVLIYCCILIVILVILTWMSIRSISTGSTKEETYYEFLYKNLKRRRSK